MIVFLCSTSYYSLKNLGDVILSTICVTVSEIAPDMLNSIGPLWLVPEVTVLLRPAVNAYFAWRVTFREFCSHQCLLTTLERWQWSGWRRFASLGPGLGEHLAEALPFPVFVDGTWRATFGVDCSVLHSRGTCNEQTVVKVQYCHRKNRTSIQNNYVQLISRRRSQKTETP